VIDWLTIHLDVPQHLWARCSAHAAQNWQVQKVCPATGEVEWSAPCRESVRSDTHQVTIKVSASRITVSGSPARSMGLPHNVWGSDNLIQCGKAHLRLAREALPGIPLPGLGAWIISKVDVTHNYTLGAAAEVRQALAYLREYDGGRYKVDTRRGETVYWSLGSAMRSAKAYHKGPHLLYQVRKGQAEATEEELGLAQLLLRLEMMLGNEWWRRVRLAGKNQWVVDLEGEFNAYWAGLIGKVEVAEMSELELIRKAAKTDGQALAAYRTWCVVKSVGHREAQESMPARTWYLHRKILFDAGLSWGDLAKGQVVPFRRRLLVLERPVNSWADVQAFLQEQKKAA
jgi:hypothetical protein